MNDDIEIITPEALNETAQALITTDKPNNRIMTLIAGHVQSYATLTVNGPEDKVGLKLVSQARLDLKAKRNQVERVRKELNADALDHQRRVNAAAKLITGLIQPTEKYLETMEEDAEKARHEKQRLALQAEEDRIRREQQDKVDQENKARQDALDKAAKEQAEREQRLRDMEQRNREWEERIRKEQEEIKEARRRQEEEQAAQTKAKNTPIAKEPVPGTVPGTEPKVGFPFMANDGALSDEERMVDLQDLTPKEPSSEELWGDRGGVNDPGPMQGGVKAPSPITIIREDKSDTDQEKLHHRWTLIQEDTEDMVALRSPEAAALWLDFSSRIRELIDDARRATNKLPTINPQP